MKVQSSLRNKIILLASALTVAAVVTISAFFLKLFYDDKSLSLIRMEEQEVQRTADTLHSLIDFARVVDLGRVASSRQVILAAEGICDHKVAPRLAVSKVYGGQLKYLDLDPRTFVNALETFLACERIAGGKDEAGAPTPEVQIVPFGVQLMIPYLAIAIRDEPKSRLVLLSLEEFELNPATSFFLVDRLGHPVWSADSREFLKQVLDDTGAGSAYLSSLPGVAAQETGARQISETGLVSYAKLSSDWTVVSVSYLPMITRAVSYAFRQIAVIGFGILCLAIFLGRVTARALVRPLEELKESAEAIGGGRLDTRFKVTGEDEFSVLKQSFNTMAEKIQLLLVDSKAKAELESDISVTRDVQALLFPKTQVKLNAVQVSSVVDFCDRCGGDWWGYIDTTNLKGNPVSIVMIGDVTGHGTPSALMTAAIRGAVSVVERWMETNRELASDPASILRLLDFSLQESSKGSLNMTFHVAIFDAVEETVLCANAGQPPGVLIGGKDESGVRTIKSMWAGGTALGSPQGNENCESQTYPWRAGSKLVLYTDGLIDLFQGERNLFGRKELRKVINEFQGLSARGLHSRIMQQRIVAAKGLPKVDDTTLVICESLT